MTQPPERLEETAPAPGAPVPQGAVGPVEGTVEGTVEGPGVAHGGGIGVAADEINALAQRTAGTAAAISVSLGALAGQAAALEGGAGEVSLDRLDDAAADRALATIAEAIRGADRGVSEIVGRAERICAAAADVLPRLDRIGDTARDMAARLRAAQAGD